MNKHQLASKRGKKLTVFLSGGYTVWKMQCILFPKGVIFLLGKKTTTTKQTKYNKKENSAEMTILPLSLSFNFLPSAILIISDFAVMEYIYF